MPGPRARTCGTRRRSWTSTSRTGWSASDGWSRRWRRDLRTEEELLDAAWSEVPAALRPAAALTLRGHLEKLREEGRLAGRTTALRGRDSDRV